VDELNSKVEQLLSESLQIPADKITDDLTMEDVDTWDSLRHMELIVAIEQGFGVELSFDEIVTMRSVGEIKRVVREKCAVS
jgi:acyl carrier protein